MHARATDLDGASKPERYQASGARGQLTWESDYKLRRSRRGGRRTPSEPEDEPEARRADSGRGDSGTRRGAANALDGRSPKNRATRLLRAAPNGGRSDPRRYNRLPARTSRPPTPRLCQSASRCRNDRVRGHASRACRVAASYRRELPTTSPPACSRLMRGRVLPLSVLNAVSPSSLARHYTRRRPPVRSCAMGREAALRLLQWRYSSEASGLETLAEASLWAARRQARRRAASMTLGTCARHLNRLGLRRVLHPLVPWRAASHSILLLPAKAATASGASARHGSTHRRQSSRFEHAQLRGDPSSGAKSVSSAPDSSDTACVSLRCATACSERWLMTTRRTSR